MRNILIILLFITSGLQAAYAQVITEWRNGRTGIYTETGLLKKWPENGPELIWYNDSLPNGHSSAAIAHNSVYLTGIIDSMEYLVALDLKGKTKWKVPFGKAWTISYPESRSTPTIEGNRVYVVSGMGQIACIDAISGQIVWTVDAAREFKPQFNAWGVSESLIIKDEKVFFSPVGKETTTIALDKKNGQLIWKTESIGDSLAYVAPILINYAGKNILVNVSASYIYGVDVNTGKIIWKTNYIAINTPKESWRPIINCVTPLYDNGRIYVTSGYDHTGVMLKLNSDASGAEVLWTDTVLDVHHGGVVKLGNYIYGSNWINNGNGNWCCIDWETGKLKYEEKWRSKGSIVSADGMLYCYEERTGYLGLVPVNPEKFEVVSSFKIPYGRGPYWSHPVIKDGILYIRHGTALMAYAIQKK
jgi:outer membrane protein assembly factor BamB